MKHRSVRRRRILIPVEVVDIGAVVVDAMILQYTVRRRVERSFLVRLYTDGDSVRNRFTISIAIIK